MIITTNQRTYHVPDQFIFELMDQPTPADELDLTMHEFFPCTILQAYNIIHECARGLAR